MNDLFSFLEKFGVDNNIVIYDETDAILYDGKLGDVPQRVMNMARVIDGSANVEGDHLSVSIQKK